MKPSFRSPRDRGQLAASLLLAGLLLLVTPALAQDPTVTAAVPDTTEQETYDLVVTISGTNFGIDSAVDFYVTGTTDPGGITVKKVRRRNPKTLEATIDVAADAQTQYRFDIQVRTGGRTGKGTELFKVLEKVVGSDTIPPSEEIGVAATDIDFNSAVLSWTAPADDGLDPLSGPALGAVLRVRSEGPWTEEQWDADLDLHHLAWTLGPDTTPPSGAPGDTVSLRQLGLAPETTYWAAVRYFDDRDNWSAITPSSEVQFTTDWFPPGNWAREPVAPAPPESACSDGNEDLEFDLDGEPAVFMIRRCGAPPAITTTRLLARRNAGAWTITGLPEHVGTGDDLAFDPVTGAATLASSNWANYDRRIAGKLQLYRAEGSGWSSATVDAGIPINSEVSFAFRAGQPVVAYPVKAKGSSLIRLAESTGTSWSIHEFAVSSANRVRLALDPAGNAALVYREAADESCRFAIWDGAAWLRGTMDQRVVPEELCGLSPTLVWNPVLGAFTAAHACSDSVGGGARVRLCHQSPATPSTWTCATFGEGINEPSLAFAPDGSFYLAYVVDGAPVLAASLDGGLTWSEPEHVDWNTDNRTNLRVDPATGLPALSYYAATHSQPALVYAHRP